MGCAFRHGRLVRRQPVSEAAASDEAHAEVGLIFPASDFVNRHDVRMIEASDGLGFLAKTFVQAHREKGFLFHRLPRDPIGVSFDHDTLPVEFEAGNFIREA